MRRLLVLVVAMCAIPARPASPITLNLRWNDCPAGPTSSQLATFLCGDNTGTFRLVGTLTSDDQITEITGMDAVVDFLAAGGAPLSDWWQMQPGGCRETSFRAVPRVTEVSTCPNLWPASAVSGFAYQYPYPSGETQNVARAYVSVAVPVGLTAHLVPGTEYYAFEILIDAQRTTSAVTSPCAGCDQHVCIAFWRADVYPSGGVQTEFRSATATDSWRCPSTAVVDIGGSTPHSLIGGGIYACTLGDCPTAALRPTWGWLKSLYR